MEAECRLLAPYAVLMRYPVFMPEPTEQDGREAAEAAARINERMRKML